ncbi:unnamed protein product [Closterium sp. Naga37s-1]|nr:unnamed protein product [Closterium sp. Naga37s-1]
MDGEDWDDREAGGFGGLGSAMERSPRGDERGGTRASRWGPDKRDGGESRDDRAARGDERRDRGGDRRTERGSDGRGNGGGWGEDGVWRDERREREQGYGDRERGRERDRGGEMDRWRGAEGDGGRGHAGARGAGGRRDGGERQQRQERRDREGSDAVPALYSIHRATVHSIRPFGMFVRLEGHRKHGLVHLSHVSDYEVAKRDDTDDAKVEALKGVAAEGEQVWVKVISLKDETGADVIDTTPGLPGSANIRIGCSMKVVSQTDGADRDPSNQRIGGGQGGGSKWRAPVKLELEAVLNVTCTRCGGQGHLKAECYGPVGASYELLADDAGEERIGVDGGGGGGGVGRGSGRGGGGGGGGGGLLRAGGGGRGEFGGRGRDGGDGGRRGMDVADVDLRGRGRGLAMTQPAWMTAQQKGMAIVGAIGDGSGRVGSAREEERVEDGVGQEGGERGGEKKDRRGEREERSWEKERKREEKAKEKEKGLGIGSVEDALRIIEEMKREKKERRERKKARKEAKRERRKRRGGDGSSSSDSSGSEKKRERRRKRRREEESSSESEGSSGSSDERKRKERRSHRDKKRGSRHKRVPVAPIIRPVACLPPLLPALTLPLIRFPSSASPHPLPLIRLHSSASPHPPPLIRLLYLTFLLLPVPIAPEGSLSPRSPPQQLLLSVICHDNSHTLILFSLSSIFSSRSLDQLEALSQQLRARTSRLDAVTETNAATRLLAREGINAEQLTKDLRSVHLKTTFEDVLPVDAGSVEEYLTQVHETSLVMAVQAAVRENTASFDSFMARAIQDDWQRDKRDLLHGLTRLNPSSFPSSFSTNSAGSAGAGTVAAAAGGIAGTPGKAQQRFLSAMSPRSAAAAASPATAAAGFASPGGGGRAVGEAREVAYAQVVGELNAAAEQGVAVKMATAMAAAYERATGGGGAGRVATAMAAAYERATGGEVRGEAQQSVGTRQIWQLVQSLLGEDEQQQSGASLSPSPSSSGAPFLRGDRMGMVVGARRHLEKGHAQYMLNVIQSHPNEASLGGSTGSLHRVRAFLRVRLRDQGPLDFDATPTTRLPPLDTTWHQIFYCLRSGFTNDALHVAQNSRSARAFAPLLATWLSSNGSIDPATSAAAADECDRMARTASHSSLSRPGASFTGAAAGGAAGGVDRRKFLLYVLISGRKALADRLLREAPSLFPTIEDFMWFHLAILRQAEPSPRSQASPSGLSFSGRDRGGWMGGFGGASGADAASAATAANSGVYCTLENLQAYLSRFDPSYYTKNGKDPLVYPYVLLLSLQLHAAVVYHLESIDVVDAVHLGIALAHSGGLQLAMRGGGGGGGGGAARGDGADGGAGGAGAGGGAGGGGGAGAVVDAEADIAGIIRKYAVSVFLRAGDVRTALEYFSVAADVIAGGGASGRGGGGATREQRRRRATVMEATVREVLRSKRGIEELLGSGGGLGGADGGGGGGAGRGGGSLTRFVGEEGAQRQVVLGAAKDCQDMGQDEEAIHLYRWARAPAAALLLVNDRFSQALAAVAAAAGAGSTDSAAVRAASGHAALGNQIIGEAPPAATAAAAGTAAAALPAGASFPDRSSLAEQQVAFRQLESIFHFYLDYAASRLPSALQHLSGLPFLPFAGRSPVACAAVLPSLHRAVEDRLPKLLEDVLSCLDRLPDADPNVRVLRNNVLNLVAGTLHRNWPQHIYELAARMHSVPLPT